MKKLKLIYLSKKEMKKIKGGRICFGNEDGSCACGCYYHGRGGSSFDANYEANIDGGFISRGCTLILR